MTNKELFEFIESNKFDNIESVLVTLNTNYNENLDYNENFFLIVYLLNNYFNENHSVDKLDYFLSDIATINYFKDKRMIHFLTSLVNKNNIMGLTFEDEFDNFKLLLDASKNYLDTKRSNYKVFDNNYISILVDLYANCNHEMSSITRELFFMVLYNNYQDISIDKLDDFSFELTKVYFNFMNDPYFINHDVTDKELLYHDIETYINNNLSNLIKPKVK